MPKRKPTDKVQLPVRMQEMLRADLEKSAKANGVSLNAEVVARLQASLLGDQLQENYESLRSTLTALQKIMMTQQTELAGLRSALSGGLGGRPGVPGLLSGALRAEPEGGESNE